MPVFDQVFGKYDDLNASVQENVSGIRVVKAFVREDFEKEKFAKASENLYRLFVKAESMLAFNNPVMMLSIYGCIIVLSWLGAHYITDGLLTTGSLTSLFSYIMSMMMSLMMLSMIFVMVTLSAASARRIAQVLDEKADLSNPDSAVKDIADGSIDFNEVSFSYRNGSGEDTLCHIDLHIDAGETIGIIGGTGCGKSSFVSLISRLYDVTEGSVCVGGQDVRSYDMEALREQVAVVLQKMCCFPAQSWIICAGAKKMPRKKNAWKPAGWHAQMNLSRVCPINIIPGSSRGAAMYPAGRNSASALHGLC